MNNVRPISGFQQDPIKKWQDAFAFIPEILKTLPIIIFTYTVQAKSCLWSNNLCWLAFSQKQLSIKVTKTMKAVHCWIYINSYLQD